MRRSESLLLFPLLLSLSPGCAPQPAPGRTAPRAEAAPKAASAPPPAVAAPPRIEGPCEPKPASTAPRSLAAVGPATRATAGAPHCRVERVPLGPGLVGDGVRLGVGPLGAVACWPKDGDHVSVRLLDAEGNARGAVWTSAAYPWLRGCEVLVGKTSALVLVHSGRAVEERQWFGLFLDEKGTLVADTLLDLDGQRGIEVSATRDDGGYLLVQLPPTASNRDVPPFTLPWLEVSAAQPRACATHVETKLFAPAVHRVQWESGGAAALRFQALDRPNTGFLESWYTVSPGTSATPAASPSAPSVEKADGEELDLVYSHKGLQRIVGRFKEGAALDVPAELGIIDLRPFAGDVFAVRNPVWTGRRYLVPLPMAADGTAPFLSVDCTPP
ncbi:MAG TPA: hypothetical protein VM694_33075 [Polyangium sp.]|nr:hypothetical protein [Polyangium sp.]